MDTSSSSITCSILLPPVSPVRSLFFLSHWFDTSSFSAFFDTSSSCVTRAILPSSSVTCLIFLLPLPLVLYLFYLCHLFHTFLYLLLFNTTPSSVLFDTSSSISPVRYFHLFHIFWILLPPLQILQ